MMKGIRTALVALALIATISVAEAMANVKLGTVDSKAIVGAMEEFKQIEGRVTAMQQSFNDTLVALKNQFDAAFQSYQGGQSTMDADTRRQTEQALQNMQSQLQQYQMTRFGDQGLLAQYQAQLQAPIREKILAAIKAVAKQQGLNVVMEEGAMLFVDPQMDITFKVLEYLKKQG